jgi:exonuclease VII small subunit
MSETAHAAIQPPEDPIPPKFADAYSELQAIAERLKPNATKVPDVDEIEPLVKRAKELADHCEERIAAVKRMLDQQDKGANV